jgi:hypothetical protein
VLPIATVLRGFLTACAVLLIVSASVGCASTVLPGQTASLPPAGTGGVFVFEPWQVTDPMAEGVVAMRFLVPKGWQASGNVVWLPQWERVAHLQTTVSDPATGITVDWLPIQDFIWFVAPVGLEPPIGSNYQGKAYVPPVTDATQFVSDFWLPNALSHLNGATLVSTTQVPAIADEFELQFGGPADAAAYRLRYEYDQGGQRWEEDVSFALLYASGAGITSWYVNFAYTARAPKGVLDADAGTVSTILASRLTTAEWEGVYRLVQKLFVQGIQQQMADTVAFGRLLAEHRAESAALQQQVTDERQASQDRIAELRQEILAGVQSYLDPTTNTYVQLPVGWNSYWVSDSGQILVSDQPGISPTTIYGGGWQQLQPRP